MEILLIFLFILPISYKILFWTYTLQLKEYRFDRFREYLSTSQGKNAIFNFWFPTEFIVFLATFTIFINPIFDSILFQVVFYFLCIENIFVLWKIFRKNVLKPVFTWRTVLLLLVLDFIIFLSIYLIFDNSPELIYSFLIWSLLFPYLLIFISNIILLPLVKYQKNKLINRAINKSKNNPNPIKIWITWSYWKSSVKEFLSSILENEWKLLKTPENINSEMWVSWVIISKLDNTYDYFVAEMWAYRIWEIALLWEIVNHKYWFLTAIWNQHLGLFWWIENTKKAKTEIAKKVLENWWNLYINYDDENIRNSDLKEWLNVVKYGLERTPPALLPPQVRGIEGELDASSKIINCQNWETEFEFSYKWENKIFKTNLIWKHNILNITWVIAFCIDLWINKENIAKYLLHIKSPKNTLEIIKKSDLVLIDDSYNLSENWLLAWIEVLNTFSWEKILVLDDILELWKEAKNIHFEIWKKIAEEKLIDKIVLVWVNYKKYFINWLINWWFKSENILKNLEKIDKNSVILFEWRGTRKVLEKIF